VEDSKKFKCTSCSTFFGKETILFFENLQSHLQSGSHKKSIKAEEKDKLSEAISYLQSQNSNNLPNLMMKPLKKELKRKI